MKRNYSKAIAALLAAIMCFSVCIFSVYAVPGEDGEVTPDPGGQSSAESGGSSEQGGGQSSDVPYIPESDPGDQGGGQSSDVPYIPDDGGQSSYSDGGGGGYDGGNQTSYENDNGNGNSSNNNVYYDSDGNSYSNQDEVYVGGGQSYQPPASTAPTAALYDTDKKVDVNELSKNDWGDIANMLKNTGTAESDGDDFAFIQKNTSKKDNGHWIIIAGAICILLSIAGFIYLIVSKISRRKKIKEGNIGKTSDPQRKGVARRSNDDYDDGYGSKGKSAKQSSNQPHNSGRYNDERSADHYSNPNKGGKGGRRYR